MTTPLILVTIISESLLKDKIIGILRRQGATGHTITNTHGEGSRGHHPTDWEGPNLKFESIVTPEVAAAIIDAVSDRYFEDHSVIAWTTEVNVVRGEKFVGSDLKDR
jgi:nitrogen regulatory protein P-II 2